MGLWKFQFQFIYLPEKNQSFIQNMAYKVKGDANYITKRIRNIFLTRKLNIETVRTYYYDWIWGNDYCCGVGY